MAPAPSRAQDAGYTDQLVATPIEAGQAYTVRSAVLGDDRQINVWLPPDYELTDRAYSTVFLVDGALDQDFPHIVGLAQLGSLSWTFGPILVVGVQTRNRQEELTPTPSDARYRQTFPHSGGAEQFRRFLESEVIPFVDRRFRTGPRKALMGESLGGLFVIDTLLKQPTLFDDYIAISPSLWWDDRLPLKNAADRLQASRGMHRRLYLAIADEGGTMQQGVDDLRAALGPPNPGTIEWRYSDRSAVATHATIYHSAAEDALRWLYPAPPYDAGPIPWFMIPGASPTR